MNIWMGRRMDDWRDVWMYAWTECVYGLICMVRYQIGWMYSSNKFAIKFDSLFISTVTWNSSFVHCVRQTISSHTIDSTAMSRSGLSPGRLQQPQNNWATPTATRPVGIISTLNSIKLLYSGSVSVTSRVFDDVFPACVPPQGYTISHDVSRPQQTWCSICILF
jgi:hypothetical protein